VSTIRLWRHRPRLPSDRTTHQDRRRLGTRTNRPRFQAHRRAAAHLWA